ncbi:tripartite motif-containing protein 5-like isoform X2 [Perca fluviatilis]|nr:tripartite motif-containing protein 5-like isoform X2 [Perca fluviatilis]
MSLLDGEKLSCPVCLELLTEPLTLPCGHSFCSSCVRAHWDTEAASQSSCPVCRETFTPRPVLQTNIVLAELVEHLKETEPPAKAHLQCEGPKRVSAAAERYGGPRRTKHLTPGAENY